MLKSQHIRSLTLLTIHQPHKSKKLNLFGCLCLTIRSNSPVPFQARFPHSCSHCTLKEQINRYIVASTFYYSVTYVSFLEINYIFVSNFQETVYIWFRATFHTNICTFQDTAFTYIFLKNWSWFHWYIFHLFH